MSINSAYDPKSSVMVGDSLSMSGAGEDTLGQHEGSFMNMFANEFNYSPILYPCSKAISTLAAASAIA